MDIEVNYINKKRPKTGRTPCHQNKFWTWPIWFLPKIMLTGKDYVDISTENDSFYCRVTGKNVITKLAFATEEIYLRSMSKEKVKC